MFWNLKILQYNLVDNASGILSANNWISIIIFEGNIDIFVNFMKFAALYTNVWEKQVLAKFWADMHLQNVTWPCDRWSDFRKICFKRCAILYRKKSPKIITRSAAVARQRKILYRGGSIWPPPSGHRVNVLICFDCSKCLFFVVEMVPNIIFWKFLFKPFLSCAISNDFFSNVRYTWPITVTDTNVRP